MRNYYGRFFLMIGILVLINIVLSEVLASLGATGIVILIAVCIASAFFITFINYPAGYRKYALKDPNFHRAFVKDAIILILLNLAINFLF